MIEALAPVAMLIGLGYASARRRLHARGHLGAGRPAGLLRAVPRAAGTRAGAADLTGLPVARVRDGACWPAQLLMAAIASLHQRPAAPGRTGLHQRPAVRRALEHLHRTGAGARRRDPAGIPLVALAVAMMVPVANVMSVAALARHGSAGRAGPARLCRAVATNPLILACLPGIALNLGGIGLPTACGALGDPRPRDPGAGPADRRRRAAAGHGGRSRPLVGLVTAAHLLLQAGDRRGAGRRARAWPARAVEVVALACAVPTATSSYILARLLGGDAVLMAALVTTTTVAALVTLPARADRHRALSWPSRAAGPSAGGSAAPGGPRHRPVRGRPWSGSCWHKGAAPGSRTRATQARASS